MLAVLNTRRNYVEGRFLHSVHGCHKALDGFFVGLGGSIFQKDKAEATFQIHTVDGNRREGSSRSVGRRDGSVENLFNVLGRTINLQIPKKHRTNRRTADHFSRVFILLLGCWSSRLFGCCFRWRLILLLVFHGRMLLL